MSDYEEEAVGAVEVEEVAEAYPSLLWVLLTRFDGFCTVVFVAGLVFLLCRALLSVQRRLEAAQAELGQRREGLDSAKVQELTAALRNKDTILNEKQSELNHLLSLVQDVDQQYTKASSVERQLMLLERECNQMKEEKEMMERALTAELGILRDRNEQLQATIDELNVQLAAASERDAHNESMLDLVVAQHQSRQRPVGSRMTPRNNTPSRRDYHRTESPGTSHAPTTSPVRIKPLSTTPHSQFTPGYKPTSYVPMSTQGYSSIPRRKLPDPIRSQDFNRMQKSQNEYLDHLDAQISLLQGLS
eukprot:TRINITY_DN26585_c0_g1_i1.p1 TRINITY_DN26585_c0_g1~~TRINITY_DN26585_c0_g1_i1.p1  ORF type:complete len:303 (+),score=119.24 TRINITY_DN26585_c0_g1_i1:584-1492(+)